MVIGDAGVCAPLRRQFIDNQGRRRAATTYCGFDKKVPYLRRNCSQEKRQGLGTGGCGIGDSAPLQRRLERCDDGGGSVCEIARASRSRKRSRNCGSSRGVRPARILTATARVRRVSRGAIDTRPCRGPQAVEETISYGPRRVAGGRGPKGIMDRGYSLPARQGASDARERIGLSRFDLDGVSHVPSRLAPHCTRSVTYPLIHPPVTLSPSGDDTVVTSKGQVAIPQNRIRSHHVFR